MYLGESDDPNERSSLRKFSPFLLKFVEFWKRVEIVLEVSWGRLVPTRGDLFAPVEVRSRDLLLLRSLLAKADIWLASGRKSRAIAMEEKVNLKV